VYNILTIEQYFGNKGVTTRRIKKNIYIVSIGFLFYYYYITILHVAEEYTRRTFLK